MPPFIQKLLALEKPLSRISCISRFVSIVSRIYYPTAKIAKSTKIDLSFSQTSSIPPFSAFQNLYILIQAKKNHLLQNSAIYNRWSFLPLQFLRPKSELPAYTAGPRLQPLPGRSRCHPPHSTVIRTCFLIRSIILCFSRFSRLDNKSERRC